MGARSPTVLFNWNAGTFRGRLPCLRDFTSASFRLGIFNFGDRFITAVKLRLDQKIVRKRKFHELE